MKYYLLYVISFVSIYSSSCYKPVVVIHGIMDMNGTMDILKETIEQEHPGTEVHILDVLHGFKSLAPMWYQVKRFYAALAPIMQDAKDGINLIGYSQGGLISRGILESFDHNISTFISLSSPQAGQYGDGFLHLIFPNYLKEMAYEVFYSKMGQRMSVANYWNDPREQSLYFKYCSFLPMINNELESNYNDDFRKNFISLKQMVLIGGPDDDMITPWQSSLFGFYGANDDRVFPMQDQDFYKLDLFGLRTLSRTDRLITHEVPGIRHLEWHKNATVVRKFIVPFLD